MSKIKKFIGEYAYKSIENMAYNTEALRSALVTPLNARAVFSELSEFEIKSLVTDISNSGTIGTIRKTTQDEIIKSFNESGYTTVIFDDEQKIAECKEYYSNGEIICTYNDLKRRMQEYYMIVAIKKDIDKIKRFENPQREDDYGTSILNIQIAKNGSHMSIKNRYNHTVNQCDATFNNDLNNIKMGLQNMVLGYYGFAGITRINNKYYKDIVNIGEIYLKYHTEKNNIYFGHFVLDGVNGMRYADTSRYYITKGTQEGHYNYPMVLDFQNKVAIDLTGDNSKCPLITKTIKEGILNSGNKEKAEEICAVFTDAKKEMLQSNKKALKYIAETYGYDFQKQYKVVGILGKFTANSIEKIIGSKSALLLVADENNLKIVKLNKGKFEAKDMKSNYQYDISTFYGQGDFESKRKSGKKAVYIIQQDKQYFREIKRESGRQSMYIDNRMKYIDEMNKSEIAQIQLKQRLKDYKANKRKMEAQMTDYTKEIIGIDNEFIALKTEIISQFVNANIYTEYNIVSDVVNYKLVWLVRDIASFKEKAINREFSSIEQAQNTIDSIKSTITQMRNNLRKEIKVD